MSGITLALASMAPEQPAANAATTTKTAAAKTNNVVPIRPGPTVERAALERDQLTKDKSKTDVDGKLKATVVAPSGTKVEVEGSGAFKKTETERSSDSGGMSKDTARKLLATN